MTSDPLAEAPTSEVGHRDRDAPERQLCPAVEEASNNQQGRAEDGARDDPEDGAEQVAVAATGSREEHEMECANDQVAAPKTTPSAPNAPGAARDTTSIAAIAANMASRTTPSSGSRWFVSQAYAD